MGLITTNPRVPHREWESGRSFNQSATWMYVMDRFSTLPSKLVILIVEEPSLESYDLSVISRLCRHLRMLVLPYLYRTISCSTFHKNINSSSCARPIHLLLRSILESPHLGAFVWFFEFGSNVEAVITGPSSKSLWELGEETFKSDIKKMVRELVYRSFLPQPARWISALEAGNVNAFLALLATRFPSLQSLDLGVNYLIDGGFLSLIFRHLWLQRSFSWPIQQPPYAFRLTRLELTCFWSDGAILKHILAVMPNLQSLKYNHWLDLSYPPGGSYSEYLDRRELGLALGQLRRTLKYLSLVIKGYWPKTYKQETPYNPQTDLANGYFSLQPFSQLDSLSLPFVIMFGYSPLKLSRPVGLPEFIRQLTISDDMASVAGRGKSYEWTASACLKRLGDCLSDWIRQAPSLELLELAFGDDDDRYYWTSVEEEEFKALCSKVGLAYRII